LEKLFLGRKKKVFLCFSIIRTEIDTQNFPNSTNKKVELKFFIKFKLYFSIFQCTNFSYSKHLQSVL